MLLFLSFSIHSPLSRCRYFANTSPSILSSYILIFWPFFCCIQYCASFFHTNGTKKNSFLFFLVSRFFLLLFFALPTVAVVFAILSYRYSPLCLCSVERRALHSACIHSDDSILNGVEMLYANIYTFLHFVAPLLAFHFRRLLHSSSPMLLLCVCGSAFFFAFQSTSYISIFATAFSNWIPVHSTMVRYGKTMNEYFCCCCCIGQWIIELQIYEDMQIRFRDTNNERGNNWHAKRKPQLSREFSIHLRRFHNAYFEFVAINQQKWCVINGSLIHTDELRVSIFVVRL